MSFDFDGVDDVFGTGQVLVELYKPRSVSDHYVGVGKIFMLCNWHTLVGGEDIWYCDTRLLLFPVVLLVPGTLYHLLVLFLYINQLAVSKNNGCLILVHLIMSPMFQKFSNIALHFKSLIRF